MHARERANLSKKIFRLTRSALRRHRTEQAEVRLKEFTRLKDLDRIHMHSVVRRKCAEPNFHECASVLAGVYKSDNAESLPEHTHVDIPDFVEAEVAHALKKMAKGRSPDTNSVVMEMFLYGGELAVEFLTTVFNGHRATSYCSQSW